MSKSTEADRVFNGVVSDIMAGVIRPRDRLSERELVSRFGVSRTPVREATKRLLERGFVEAGPKGVAVVVDIGPDDLRKLYSLRLQLEGAAARQIAANIQPEQIEALKQINRKFKSALMQRDLLRMLEVRAEFHGVLAGATQNRWLEMVLAMLRDKAYMVRHYHWQDFDRAAQTLDIHNQMIKALERRDAAAFQQLVCQQISAAISTYENRLQVPAWSAPSPRTSGTARSAAKKAPPRKKAAA
ncbi:MAG TPA: GntR family transcriptional regulator [Ramlibacter sp.]|uniref:GntR family transcriptional regulator n=1 Tax=Ramlibacter sp. TaxID=1917967 RepID=UPI002CEAD4E6|nr:GntR family transcriptional regulator [Ramlibacter sp.]HVZ45596.1 GntR family transcriptional regulator [Ramlibacter sp.]